MSGWADHRSAEEVVRDFMRRSCAWPTGDAASSADLSEDAEYLNGRLKPVHGREPSWPTSPG